ncbi:MAG: SoxR reducing system RseC family protein [Firmicutes bacterium]|nr:SoxR reducing system RseC family protein [Bacillota bacterium]
MIETGKVIDTQNNTAKVLIKRHTACGDCGACQVGKDNLNLIITVENSLKAQKNDLVIIELNTGSFLFASLILYGIPLLALIFGIIVFYYTLEYLGYQKSYLQLIPSLAGLLLMSISYIMIKKNESKFQSMNRFKSEMIEIINKI